MFIWVPVSSFELSSDSFIIFAYVVPEIVPSLLQLALVQAKRSKTERDARFISDLYAEHDDVRRFEATVEDETPSPYTSGPNSRHGSYARFPTIESEVLTR